MLGNILQLTDNPTNTRLGLYNILAYNLSLQWKSEPIYNKKIKCHQPATSLGQF